MSDRRQTRRKEHAGCTRRAAARLRLPSVLLALLLFAGVAVAAPGNEQNVKTPLAFADHLFEQGDYYRAITEYERVLFLFPGTPEAMIARFQIARSYFQSEKYMQAIERFLGITMDFPGDPLAERSQLLLGESYYYKGEYQQAVDAHTAFLSAYPRSASRDAARIRLGWCYLRQGNWPAADEEFRKLPPDSPLAGQGQGLADGARNYPQVPRKSPALAGALAMFPGAGHLYLGKPGEALGSLLLNGIFIWGAIETSRNGNHVAAGILAFFELGWYTGNIFTAISGAREYNRREEKKYFDRLDSQYGITLSALPDGGIVTALQLRF